jgi:hypothetical protein
MARTRYVLAAGLFGAMGLAGLLAYLLEIEAKLWAVVLFSLGAASGGVLGWLGREGVHKLRRPRLAIPLVIAMIAGSAVRGAGYALWTLPLIGFFTVFAASEVYYAPLHEEVEK